MNSSLVKYVFRDRDTNNNRWAYCCKNKIPFVSIIKAGNKYCKIEFDAAAVTQNERFVIVDYCDHIIPLYDLYCAYSKLPPNKKSYAGGTRNLVFTVFNKDAEEIADKLFDLLFLLSKQDQQLFDENPFKVNEAGFNSEGFHVGQYIDSLKEMSETELELELKMMLLNNPTMHQTIQLIQDEIDFRKG